MSKDPKAPLRKLLSRARKAEAVRLPDFSSGDRAMIIDLYHHAQTLEAKLARLENPDEALLTVVENHLGEGSSHPEEILRDIARLLKERPDDQTF